MFKKLAQMTLTRSARNDKRPGGSAIDGRTSHKAGYVASQIVRKRVEEPFGWGKTIGPLRQLKGKRSINPI